MENNAQAEKLTFSKSCMGIFPHIVQIKAIKNIKDIFLLLHFLKSTAMANALVHLSEILAHTLGVGRFPNQTRAISLVIVHQFLDGGVNFDDFHSVSPLFFNQFCDRNLRIVRNFGKFARCYTIVVAF